MMSKSIMQQPDSNWSGRPAVFFVLRIYAIVKIRTFRQSYAVKKSFDYQGF